jgi:hypothetical protein
MSKPRVLIVCDKPETEKGISEIFARTAEFLSSFSEFTSAMAELDEDKPNVIEHDRIYEKLLLNFVNIYPTPNHLEADIETFKSVFLKGLRNKKQRGN